MKISIRGHLSLLLDEFGLPRVAVEVGVAEGRFAKEMFDWGLSQLYLVDIWERVPFIEGCASFEEKWHQDNFKQVNDMFSDKSNVIIIKNFSHKAVKFIDDESVGLVYIDGDHTYNGAKTDIEVWWPKLVTGGIMAFHDFMNGSYGVNRAVTEFASVRGIEINIIEENNQHENMGAWIRK